MASVASVMVQSGRRAGYSVFLCDDLCSQEGVGAGDEDGGVDGDFAVGDADDG